MCNTAGNSYFLVSSNPVPGKEDAFNEWYDKVHLPEVIALEGILRVQRFQLSHAQMMIDQPYQYTTVYEVAKGCEREVVERLTTASKTFNMQPVIENVHIQVLEAMGGVLTS